MTIRNRCILFLQLFLLTTLASSQTASTATITGYVTDSAATFRDDASKPISPAYVKACAKGGSPLVILSQDDRVYLPIDGASPAKSQNHLLLKYAGKRVTVVGKVLQRGGAHAIIIEQIQSSDSTAE